MNKKLQKTTNNLPAWDLSDLYDDIKSDKIEKDLEKYRKSAIAFARKYKGRLALLSADEFLSVLKDCEKRNQLVSRLGGFAYLNMATQMKNQEAMAFYQNISEKITQYSKPLVFFSLELNQLPEEKIKEWLKNKKVAFYKPFIKRVRKYKKYELSEAVEEILLEKSVTSSDAWVRLYEETSSRQVFELDGKKYNDAEISKLLLDKDINIRHKAGEEINRVAKQNAPLFSLVYNMIIKDKAIEDEKRGFKNPVSARNLAEEVDDNMVEALAQTVKENYKNIAHRFYKLKAKWLGTDKLSYWDRNAPLPFSADIQYSWEEAVDTVLKGYYGFSEKLGKIAQEFFDNAWIDVPPRDGKRSGAFCSAPLASEHPYLFLNFTGKQNDVLTLAHELGHGCHHQLRTNNGDLNERSRMTTEEVASVFGEMLVFQNMLNSTTDDKAKLCLIASKVSDMINTAIRQISFHFFETRAHNERKNGEVSEDRLCQIWLEEMKESLGEYVVVDDNCKYIWSNVGHFFFLPFYVYAYSFADCLVNSLYQVKIEDRVDNFADKYLELLSKTAIGEYEDILKPFGLNPKNADFWQKGLNLISSYIDELEKLDKKINK
ncbi:MAG: M3 family oligoendopeptidase [Alphaproteobacteria bacterium]|nr:M3 family oligoendopeptidase [Alphaproteobacteria bacterium]